MNNSNMKNSLTQKDLKCGTVAYEVTALYINTVLFVSDVYISKSMNTKCIDYKSFYRNGDNVVLGNCIERGFLNDYNIEASYNKNYWFSDYYSAREYFDSIHDKNKANKVLTRLFS